MKSGKKHKSFTREELLKIKADAQKEIIRIETGMFRSVIQNWKVNKKLICDVNKLLKLK